MEASSTQESADKDFLLDNCDEVIIKTDSQKNIAYVNKAAKSLFGIDCKNVCGNSFLEIGFPPSLLNQWENALNIIYDLAQEEVFEFACTVHNNSRHFNFKLFPDVKEGSVQSIVTYISDVSKSKQLELEYDEHVQLLEKVRQEMDHLVYHVSHDLRGPLSSLLGLIALAKEEQDVDKLHEYVDLEEKSILKLNTYTEEIVQLARNSRMPLDNKPIDFEKLVDEVFLELEYLYRNDPIVKVITVSQTTDFHTDEMRVKNILKNLLNNAIKFRKPQQHHVKIHVNIQVGKEEAKVEIKDNGQGIAPEHMEKIFRMYYKGTAYKAGAGLGLYIVKNCIEQLAGQIRVSSVVGTGTSFQVTIPHLAPKHRAATPFYHNLRIDYGEGLSGKPNFNKR